MDESMRRSDERYYADIKAVLQKYYRPGDTMTLTRRFFDPRKCQMCGDKVDIRDCFVLQNDRTKEEIVCGKHCVVKYVNAVEQMGQSAIINCPSSNKKAAARINQLRPNTVTILLDFNPDDSQNETDPEEDELDEDEKRFEMYDALGLDPDDPDIRELAAEGLNPDEYDWESHDYDPD